MSKSGRVTLSAKVPRSTEICTCQGSPGNYGEQGQDVVLGQWQATATEMSAQTPEKNCHLGVGMPGKQAEERSLWQGYRNGCEFTQHKGLWKNTAQARVWAWAWARGMNRRDQSDIQESGQVSRCQPQRIRSENRGIAVDTEPGDRISSKRGELNSDQRTKTVDMGRSGVPGSTTGGPISNQH